ncbi:thiamine pyrophosphate-binding protein [Nocardia tengchongensis]|uniref:thiamine pyrophosphate-binding protein n=1 Tax=Nocardia tengchongensis TaxID=2055889 RepID=UPI0036818270
MIGMGRVCVAEYLVRACAELGVRHFFGVDGANIETVFDAACGPVPRGGVGVRGVVAKHEFAAATMADGYARATGGLGVVAATSGGGAMNLVAGLAESFTSGVPVLALVGQPPRDHDGRGAFQDTSGLAGSIDAARLFAAVSRFCARVERAQDLPAHFAAAVEAALSGGPAVLLLPKDVQCADAGVVRRRSVSSSDASATPTGLSAVAAALRAVPATDTIVMIAGEQVRADDARGALRELAGVLGASVAVTPDSKDVYGPRDPGYCGVAGAMGHPELLDVVRSAELCVLVGTRLPLIARPSLGDIPIVSVGAQSPYVPAVHVSSSNLAASLSELSVMMRGTRSGPPVSDRRRHDRPRQTPSRLRPPVATGPGLRYQVVMETISELLPTGSAVFVDAGNTGAAAVHHLDLPLGGRFSLALGMGGMGYSFGAAIGSVFADRRPTYVIAGDGSFFMHGMEVHTAIEYALPITFVILNNNAHAMCVVRDRLYGRNHDNRNRFHSARLAEGMAAMFPGLDCHTVRGTPELRAVLSTPCVRGPRFVEIECDPDEIPPFAPFLAALG